VVWPAAAGAALRFLATLAAACQALGRRGRPAGRGLPRRGQPGAAATPRRRSARPSAAVAGAAQPREEGFV
jgi:hypothetical protein